MRIVRQMGMVQRGKEDRPVKDVSIRKARVVGEGEEEE